MYNNAGKRIKGYVKTVVSISIFACIMFGILIAIILGDMIGFAGVCIGLLIAGLGSFLAWLSGLTLYAFGDIADRLKRIDEKLNGLDKTEEGTPETPASENGWTCAECYKVNENHDVYCTKCGSSKSWSDHEWSKKNG